MSEERDAPLAGVFGWPASHSKSPALHGHWLRRYGIKGWYLPLPVRPEDFAEVLGALPRMGFVGANVTMPHKAEAFRRADEATPLARRLRAANTLTFREGRLFADNTDGFGFIENLRQNSPGWSPAAGPVAVIGAGGASRAVIAALAEAGAPEIRLLNRTLANSEELQRDLDLPLRLLPMEKLSEALEGAALAVNATALGMAGGPPFDLDLSALAPETLATDLIYAPLKTPFLEAAEKQGARIVDGLGMLLHQARPGFAAWFGREPEVDEDLRRAVLEAA